MSMNLKCTLTSALVLSVTSIKNSLGFVTESSGFRSIFKMFKSTVAPKLSIFDMKTYSLPYRNVRLIFFKFK